MELDTLPWAACPSSPTPTPTHLRNQSSGNCFYLFSLTISHLTGRFVFFYYLPLSFFLQTGWGWDTLAWAACPAPLEKWVNSHRGEDILALAASIPPTPTWKLANSDQKSCLIIFNLNF